MSEQTPETNQISDNFRRYVREPAKRIFASELREVTHQFKDGTEDMSPSFVLLPTGERCNRIFIVGKLTDKKSPEGENSFLRAKVIDPTGTFFVNAGSYQQEALQQFSSIETDKTVAIVGKPAVRNLEDKTTFVSVKAESVFCVDQNTMDSWILDTAKATLDRLLSEELTDDRKNAKEIYSTSPDKYKQMIQKALKEINI